jgi:hypothetical protein
MNGTMEYKIVAWGVDTLVIGYHITEYLNPDFERLDEAKLKAGEKLFGKTDSPIDWFGNMFNVLPRGSRGYEWILRNNDINVCIAREAKGGKVLPEVYVTYSALYLWTEGLAEATGKVDRWLSKWTLVESEKPSRCDICMDMVQPLPEIDLNREIVAMPKKRVDHGEGFKVDKHASGRRSTGYTFGGGDLMCRIYDKTTEIIQHQKEWMREFWLAKEWDGISPVTRYEFQARRGFLKLMQVTTLIDLIQRLPDMWRYYTNDWIRVCDEGSTTNQARWYVKEYWQVLQSNCSLFGETFGILPYRVNKVKYEHLMKQSVGCLVTASAIMAAGYGMEEGLFRVRQELRDILVSYDFRLEVEKRKGSVAHMGKPSTHLVDAIMRMGGKIESQEFISENKLSTANDKAIEDHKDDLVL